MNFDNGYTLHWCLPDRWWNKDMRWCYLIVVIDRHRWKECYRLRVIAPMSLESRKSYLKNILIPFDNNGRELSDTQPLAEILKTGCSTSSI